MGKLNRPKRWNNLFILILGFIIFTGINVLLPGSANASIVKPTLSTEDTNPASTAVTFAGMIMENGGDNSTYWGFKYGTDSRPDLNGKKEGTEFWGTLLKNVTFTKTITLTPGTYYYCSFAMNKAGTGYGPVKRFTVQQPLSAPEITEPSSDGKDISLGVQGGFTVKWNPVNGAERYIVAVRDEYGNLTPVVNDQVRDTQYTVSYIAANLKAGYSYTIEVSAVRGNEMKTSKRKINIIPPTPNILTPSRATVDINNIDISWDRVYVGPSQNATFQITIMDLTTGQAVSGYTNKIISSTSFTLPASAAILNHKYRVSIAAVNNGVNGNKANCEFTVTGSSDTEKPKVVKTTPSDGAICTVSLGTLTVEFNEDILPGPNISSITVAQAGMNSLGVNPKVQGKILTLNVSSSGAPFQAGKTYIAKLPAGAVKDTAGNTCDAYQFTFSIDAGGDGSAPYVLSSNPSNGQQGVSSTQAITIIFNEAVVKQVDRPVIIINTIYGDATVKTSQVLDSTGKILTITRTDGQGWGAGSVYTCTLSFNNIKDRAGNVMAHDHSFTFAVAAASDPTVTINSPLDGAIITKGQKVVISGSGTNCTAMAIRINGQKIKPDTITATSICKSWDTTNVAIGTHKITVNAYNSNTNKNIPKSITVTIKEEPAPVITVQSPLNGKVYPKGDVRIKATATNAVAMNTYFIKADGSETMVFGKQIPGSSIDQNVSIASSGNYRIKVTAVNSKNISGVPKYINFIVGDQAVKINSVSPSVINTGGSKNSRVDIYGSGFIGSVGQVDVVTFILRESGREFTPKSIDRVDPGRIIVTLPFDMPVGKYDIKVTKTATNQAIHLYNNFEIKPIEPPAGLKATPVSPGQIALTWNAVGGATLYMVSRANSVEGPYSKINTVTVTKTRYNDTGLTTGMTYYYKVQAVNSSGTSSYSTPVSVKIKLPAPKIDINYDTDKHKVILNWRPVAGAAYYNVHRTNATNGQKQKFVVPKGTAFKDLTAESGNSYWHAVVAVSSDGEEGLWPESLFVQKISEQAQIMLDGQQKDGKGGLSLAYISSSDNQTKNKIMDMKNKLEKFDRAGGIFTTTYLINDPTSTTLGVNHGHNAVLLLKGNKSGLLFSYWPEPEASLTAGGSCDGILHFAVLEDGKKVDSLLNGIPAEAVGLYWRFGKPKGWALSDKNTYKNNLKINITDDQGKAIYMQAAKVLTDPGKYKALAHQCSDVANDILYAGGKGVAVTGHGTPNVMFDKMKELYKKLYPSGGEV